MAEALVDPPAEPPPEEAARRARAALLAMGRALPVPLNAVLLADTLTALCARRAPRLARVERAAANTNLAAVERLPDALLGVLVAS